jgi:hypothetical protein
MLHLLSSIVFALILAGVWCRKRWPAVHVRLMTAAFVCDLLLVLYIEASRHAVETVVGRGTSLIWFHATISTLVLVAYIAQIVLGRQMLAGIRTPRRVHALLGIAFVTLRSLNYVTSFMV